mgnify:CR=1 FL=1
MIVPKLYQIKTVKQKHTIVKNIVKTIEGLDLSSYPNISRQLENDTSKVDLIDMVIINMYSPNSGSVSIENAIDSIEVTLN